MKKTLILLSPLIAAMWHSSSGAEDLRIYDREGHLRAHDGRICGGSWQPPRGKLRKITRIFRTRFH